MSENLIARLEKELDEIKNNDLHHIKEDIVGLSEEFSTHKNDFVELKTDVRWLKKTYWVVASASIGAFIAAIFNIIKNAH